MDKVWTPDFVTYNVLSEQELTTHSTRVLVRHDGSCQWMPPILLRTSRAVDMTYYPFDQQTCKIKIGSWTHSKQQLAVLFKYPTVGSNGTESALVFSPDLYVKSSEWELVSSKMTLNEVQYQCCTNIYQDVTISLTQKRFPRQPVLLLLVPCVITATMILLSFLLPPDSGEKVGLSAESTTIFDIQI